MHPLTDRYYNANHIEVDDFNISSEDQIRMRDSKKFSSVGINMRSLANTKNFAKLQVFVASLCFEPTVIAINETYLRDNEDGPHCDLENYTFKSNCRDICKGGGVGLYIHDSLQYKVRQDLTIMNEKVFESYFIETLNLEEPVIFGTIYRSPKQDNDTVSSFISHLDQCLTIIDKTNKCCFIQGDFNFNLIDIDDNHIADFKEKMFDYSFFSLINKPTRITDKTATCIDHIWSNVFDDRIISGIITEMIADHMATFQSCNIGFREVANKKQKEIHEVKKIDFNKVRSALDEVNTDFILGCPNVNVAYSYLQDYIDDAIERSSFIQRRKTRKSNQWFDHELLKLRAKRQMLYHKKLKNNSAVNKTAYDEVKKRYEKLIIAKKKSYYQSLIRKYNSDMRRTWGVINGLLGKTKKRDRISTINIGGTACDDSQKIANEFNNFFSNIPKKLHKKLPKFSNRHRIEKCLSFLKRKKISKRLILDPTTYEEVYEIIRLLRNKSSTGLDNVSPKLLKHLPRKIIFCFVHIFNLSMKEGKFVECFKYAKVVPIHKGESKLDMGNYRPISLLPVASKILEKIVHRRLYDFLSQNNFFNECQFGFRSNHSTELAASCLINKICNALNDKKKVMSVFLDMSKAFDCVDHDILLEKMNVYGVCGKSLSWFKSYLGGRYQKVMVNGVLSENIRAIECGVPQGSILGPLLYLIYINDINESLHYSDSILYADDTTLIICGETYEDLYRHINEDLVTLNEWLSLNKLTLNLKKTKYMAYTLSNRAPQTFDNLKIMLGGIEIERVPEFKFLGIYIDEHLTWKPHMNKLLSKIHRNLGVVRKISCFLNKETLLQMYHAMVMSHIRYGITVWHHGQVALRKKIQACTNKFLRMIYFMKRRDSVKSLMKENGMLSVNQIFHLETAKIMQRVSLGAIPVPFIDIFRNQTRTATMVTRYSSNFFQSYTSFQKCKQSISYTGPYIWNGIPVEIKVMPEADISNDLDDSSYENDSYITCTNSKLFITKFKNKMKKFALDNINFI